MLFQVELAIILSHLSLSIFSLERNLRLKANGLGLIAFLESLQIRLVPNQGIGGSLRDQSVWSLASGELWLNRFCRNWLKGKAILRTAPSLLELVYGVMSKLMIVMNISLLTATPYAWQLLFCLHQGLKFRLRGRCWRSLSFVLTHCLMRLNLIVYNCEVIVKIYRWRRLAWAGVSLRGVFLVKDRIKAVRGLSTLRTAGLGIGFVNVGTELLWSGFVHEYLLHWIYWMFEM